MSELLTLASIARVRGLRGEVVADFHTDFPERFQNLKSVCLGKPGFLKWYDLESFWFQKGRIILKFLDIDDPDSARELVGCEVMIPEEDRFSLPEGHFYDVDLVGCRIIHRGEVIGTVEEVFRPGGEVSNLVVREESGLEFMVPLVSDFCFRVDPDKGEIEVDLPPGMTDLAVPAKTGKKKLK